MVLIQCFASKVSRILLSLYQCSCSEQYITLLPAFVTRPHFKIVLVQGYTTIASSVFMTQCTQQVNGNLRYNASRSLNGVRTRDQLSRDQLPRDQLPRDQLLQDQLLMKSTTVRSTFTKSTLTKSTQLL